MHIATKSSKIDLSSENKTEELAKKISKKLKPKDIIYLYGEMGVGKTTFVRYLINEFQKKNKLQITEVTSPTFNILCEYDVNQIKINHYDLFRLKTKEEILNLIGIDYLKNKDDYEINLIFDNNSHIVLTTETIEVRLEDQNEIKKI